MSVEYFPRLVVVSAEPIGGRSSTGITLENLFSLWPEDRLFQVHTAPAPASPAGISFQWDESLIFGATRLRRLADRRSAGAAMATTREDAAARAAELRPSWQRAWMDQLPLKRPRDLEQLLAAFEPEVIYTPLGFSRVLRMVKWIASQTGVRVVPHFMDDWPPNVLLGAAEAVPRRLVMRDLSWIMENAPLGLAISQEMADEYKVKYAKYFVPVGNFVDIGPPAAPPVGDPVVFGYVGGLHLDRATPLLQVARAVESLDGKARLEIVCPSRQAESDGPKFSSFRWTTLRPPVAPAEVAELLTTYNVLVHVESDDESTKRWARLSLSTKIPQYLASGRPVLAYGPLEVASMGHLARSGGAVLVQTGNQAALADRILELATNPTERRLMGSNGRRFAASRHEREGQTAVLSEALRSAARIASR